MINISLSFDDGRHDNYVIAKNILEPMNIPATFNVTIGYILNDKNIEKPSENEPMTINELRDLANNKLFEISSHGYEHNNDVDNLIYGAKKIKEKLYWKDNKKIGIVSPHSQFMINKIDTSLPKFKLNNIIYLRVGARFGKIKFIRKIVRKLNRVFHIPFLSYWVYKESFVKKSDNFILYSIGIYKYNTYNEVKYIIDKCIRENKSIIFEFHSILRKSDPFYDNLYMWEYDDFYKLCKYLKKLEMETKINICKVKDIKGNNYDR